MDWSDKQQAVFEAVRSGEGHLMVDAVAGCISGDAMIGVNRAGKGFSLKLSEVVRRFNGGVAGGKTWRQNISTYVRAPFPDGTVRLAKLDAAVESGTRETFIVSIGERRVRATANHKFLTPSGFVPLSDLRTGDMVLVEQKNPGRSKVRKRNYLSRLVPFHPQAVNTGRGMLKVPSHRLNVEAHMNEMDLESFVWRLQTSAAGLKFLPSDLHVHHKDNHVQNNGLGNLEVLTKVAHARHHIGEGMWTKMVTRSISSIKRAGVVRVYDLTVPGPDAFMVNGVAVHNSGKTTTILEAMKHVPQGKTCLFVAFNKSIATELARRAPPGVEVSTLHSLGLKACSRALDRPSVDGDKAKDIAAGITGVESNPAKREWTQSVVKAVSLAKSYLASTPEQIEEVVDLHQICPPEKEEEREAFVRDVQEVLAACKAITGSVDFDDMVWLPVILDLKVPQYDRVFVDETQDLNAGQIALVRKALKANGRICAVGDPRQAIYQFRGAAADAFDKVRTSLDAKVLPLSVTYRCARAVVREAAVLVPHLEAAPDAEEGAVLTVTDARMLADARAGDFVLSRVNAPLLKLCLAFLREGRRAAIQGRDIGTKLQAIVRRAKTQDVEAMLEYVARWASTETARLEKRGRDSSGVEDTRECLYALAEGETQVQAVCSKIEKLFADGDEKTRITLSSTHKAKGMERDRVWLLRDTYMRKRKGQAVSLEEANLLYVGITRARRELFLVRSTEAA